MKTIFSIILMFAVCSLYAQKKEKKARAQDDVYATGETNTTNAGSQAPKKTYKIIVKNDLTADDNFKLVGQTLAENDFIIETKDKEFYTIKTGPKNVWKNSGRFIMLFAIKDKAISVTGQCNMDMSVNFGGVISEASFDKIVNKGMKGSFIFDSFKKMEEFTLKLGTVYEYVTE